MKAGIIEMATIYVNMRNFTVLKVLTDNHYIDKENFLVTDGKAKYTIEQIHLNPDSYLSFGNVLEAEINNYKRLRKIGIRVPILVDIDINRDYILKEYLDGVRATDLIALGHMKPELLNQVQKMSMLLYSENLNINYDPINFMIKDGLVYYINYECFPYTQEKDFEHFGKELWSSNYS